MNNRENYTAFLNHEQTEWVPNLATSCKICGGGLEFWENGPVDSSDGYDWFGVRWLGTVSAGGAKTPHAGTIPLDDVCDWEDKVKWPDLDKIDWEAYAEPQLAGLDRSQMLVEYHSWNSIFLRLTHLLSFEEAFCAFYEEPEATHALCEAITDYKIRLLERAKKYFDPDVFIHYDDFATASRLFMSPEVYREFIKPCHLRLNEAALAMDIIPGMHTCGYCQDVIEDMIDEKAATWQSAQPVNDIAMIIEKYGDRIGVVGGYDTQGEPAMPKATDEMIVKEVERCMEEYGKFGRSFAFFAFFLGDKRTPEIQHQYGVLFKAADEYGRSVPARLRAEGKLPTLAQCA